ncbi:uncharacterized protein Z518_10426 [Rhinocladiella mackenziei CBS 650.93]|uniref:Uncharacterized protein n=1 Tax=Rhinocladiella mackenziei CBS 650.93 TaxID=1442369 RepID=A0A0D2FDX0_9EURO|nr:uncharacterized protein Z518_10426 [Rhinocladiella mackenziei CBS 650.93]KIX00287.1 hypothetical protein Z518_10426 [Rhinocladiella mackenziei CBS 650.93]
MAEAEILTSSSAHATNDSQDLQQILQAILQTNENLAAQNTELCQLLISTQDASVPCWKNPLQLQEVNGLNTNNFFAARSLPSRFSRLSTVEQASSPNPNEKIWEGILSLSATKSKDFMEKFFYWDRPEHIEMVLSERSRWTSWSYAASFPELSKFMKRTHLSHRSSCQVWMDDLSSREEKRSISYKEYKKHVRVLWDGIKDRRPPASSHHMSLQADHTSRCSIRLFQIVDLSPLVLAAILGSTPQSDLSYMAAFVERYLSFSNWGKVSLLKFGDMSWSSFTIEYHFSFYYVSAEYSSSESTKHDPRQWRKSAPFGREMATETRFIHEETLSFLLIGHFKDIATCFQLAEAYFKFDPYKKNTQPGSFRPYLLDQPPAILLLSWISVGLHHVLWRWQSSIEAVESEIKSSRQIIFLEDRSDLMADDPQFSLSKTYFWALQAYKLFEQTLLETITTWKRFKIDSLPRLQDPRVSVEDWNIRVQDIDDAIEELDAKVSRIRKRIEEVKDLRTGLISASALFDSRTAVRQGENIRLLTYITILFFPLSFATSIFSMQILTPSSRVLTSFIIALPTITLGTALLVFNLEHILKMWTSTTSFCSSFLRLRMRAHRRKDWRDRAIALHEDLAVSKPPVRKAQRQYSGWIYLFFLMEYVLVAFPVSELIALMTTFGILNHPNSSKSSLHQRQSSTQLEFGKDSAESESTKHEQRMERIRKRVEQSLEDERKREKARKRREQGPVILVLIIIRKASVKVLQKIGLLLFTLLRSLLVPVWTIILLVEYIILVIILLLRSLLRNSFAKRTSVQAKEPTPFLRAAQILDLTALVPRRKAKIVTDYTQDPADFEFRAVTRVATKLNLASPRIKTSTSMSSLHTSSSTTKLVKSPIVSTSNSRSDGNSTVPPVIRTYTDPATLAHHAEDILRVRGPGSNRSTTSTAVRKAFNGRPSAQTNRPTGLEMNEIGTEGAAAT